MKKFIIPLVLLLTILSCDGPSAPSAPPKPITVLTSVSPKSTEISGTLGEYLKIVDAAYDVEGNDRQYSITLTVEAMKPTGPINSGGWKCAEMSLTLLNEKQMPVSGLDPATSADGLKELHNILVVGSGQAFIKFSDYKNNADSLIKNFATSFIISGRPLNDHVEQSQLSTSDANTTSESSVATSTQDSDTNSSSTNSECKKWLDDYDSWVTKYIAFMRKYKKNPADMSMLSDYSRLTSEMTKWANGNSDCDDAASIARMTEIANRLNRELASM
jgi:hypothetical protein